MMQLLRAVFPAGLVVAGAVEICIRWSERADRSRDLRRAVLPLVLDVTAIVPARRIDRT